MDLQDLKLLEKYLKGNASIDEQARVEKLISSEGDKHQIRQYIHKDWNRYFNSDELTKKDLTSILDRIHHAIHLKENESRRTIIHRIYRWTSAAAAILLIPMLIIGIYFLTELGEANRLLSEKPSSATIVSPLGSRMAFQLPDGTDGVLNSGSEIEYSIPFTDNRNIKLVGEAYFDVKHNEKHPFCVATNSFEIKVLGTRFNVYDYAELNKAEVILEEGSVECIFRKTKQQISMESDERIVLSEEKITKSRIDASKYTAWKEGKLIFRGDLMEEMAKRIERWYNVEVEIADEELYAYSFRGTFVNDPLEEVLRLLKMTSPIDYKIEKRKALPDGSFTKRKVVFYKSK